MININKQGGTHSPFLCILVWNMYQCAINNKIALIAQHIAGKANILGRSKILPTEWMLNKVVVQKIVNMWEMPQIDLFAIRWNCQIQTFVSSFPDELSLSVDAFSLSWEGILGDAYPPIIHSILHHTQKMSPLCPFVLLSLVGVGLAGFNCLNPGYDCKNNGLCDYFGRCKCPQGYQGYDCGLDSSTISSSVDCRATCVNKGICHSNTVCYCTDDFVGPQCEVPVLSPQCGLTTVKVRGYQPLTFRGEMYLKQSMFGCQLREMVSDIPGMRLFELEIPHRAITPCALTKTQNNETGDTIYEVEVATAHNKGFFSMSDTVHSVNCVYEARRIGENPVDVTKAMNPFKVTLMNDNNEPLRQVQRGDPYFFNVESSGKFPDKKGTRLSYLEAYSVDQQTGMVKSVKIIEDECPVRSTITGYGISISNEENSRAGFFIGRGKIESFNILDQEPIRLDYRAKICTGQCKQAVCNSPTPMRIPSKTPFEHLMNPIDIV